MWSNTFLLMYCGFAYRFDLEIIKQQAFQTMCVSQSVRVESPFWLTKYIIFQKKEDKEYMHVLSHSFIHTHLQAKPKLSEAKMQLLIFLLLSSLPLTCPLSPFLSLSLYFCHGAEVRVSLT